MSTTNNRPDTKELLHAFVSQSQQEITLGKEVSKLEGPPLVSNLTHNKQLGSLILMCARKTAQRHMAGGFARGIKLSGKTWYRNENRKDGPSPKSTENSTVSMSESLNRTDFTSLRCHCGAKDTASRDCKCIHRCTCGNLAVTEMQVIKRGETLRSCMLCLDCAKRFGFKRVSNSAMDPESKRQEVNKRVAHDAGEIDAWAGQNSLIQDLASEIVSRVWTQVTDNTTLRFQSKDDAGNVVKDDAGKIVYRHVKVSDYLSEDGNLKQKVMTLCERQFMNAWNHTRNLMYAVQTDRARSEVIYCSLDRLSSIGESQVWKIAYAVNAKPMQLHYARDSKVDPSHVKSRDRISHVHYNDVSTNEPRVTITDYRFLLSEEEVIIDLVNETVTVSVDHALLYPDQETLIKNAERQTLKSNFLRIGESNTQDPLVDLIQKEYHDRLNQHIDQIASPLYRMIVRKVLESKDDQEIQDSVRVYLLESGRSASQSAIRHAISQSKKTVHDILEVLFSQDFLSDEQIESFKTSISRYLNDNVKSKLSEVDIENNEFDRDRVKFDAKFVVKSKARQCVCKRADGKRCKAHSALVIDYRCNRSRAVDPVCYTHAQQLGYVPKSARTMSFRNPKVKFEDIVESKPNAIYNSISGMILR